MRFTSWLVLTALSLLSATARADPFEFMRALALHPSDPRLIALRYEGAYGGLLLSRDGGHSFALLPSLAISKYSLQGNAPIQFASDGKLLIAMDDGLRVDDLQGCRVSDADSPLESTPVVDLAPHPSDPAVVFALTMAHPDREGHAGLWQRSGSVVTPLGTSDPAPLPQRRHLVQPTSLEVVARAESAGGLRFIEGAVLSDDGDPTKETKPVLRVSDDLGATWTTHEIAAGAGLEGLPRLLVVEGSDPFRALVAVQVGSNTDLSEQSGPDPIDPLFLTTNGGATFSPHSSALKMADQALRLPSGQVLIADRGKGGGLWSAPDIAAPLTKVQQEPVHCLGHRADTDTVLLCRGYEFGVYDVAANSFCAFFQNREVSTLASCPSQPLTANKNAVTQLCEKWCGPLHFASSPACASTPALASCMAFAIEYDQDAEFVEAPGDSAAPRCAPPPLPPPDAGTSDAGTGDAGAVDDGDDAGEEDPADDDLEPRAGDGKGCGCRLARARSSDSPLSIASLLALSTFAWWRRARRQARV